jgi:cytochrome c oxidase cbb3-type subunit 3
MLNAKGKCLWHLAFGIRHYDSPMPPRFVTVLFALPFIGAAAAATQQTPATPLPIPTQSFPPQQVQAGEVLFVAHCGFCHGRDAMGGESGPDLTKSVLVAADVKGDKIGPVVRNGRPEKGMPPLPIGGDDLASIVAFIHTQRIKAASRSGGRRSVEEEDLATGDADAGRRYFEGPGGCTKCHSASGDFDGLADRLKGLDLLQRMLYPSSRQGARTPVPAKATVKLRSGETITGRLAYRDEFTIAVRDARGRYRSWAADQVTCTIDNPLEAHSAQLAKYTDEDMHNVLAYLRTLRK